MIIDTIIYLRKSREDLYKEDTLENHRTILTQLCDRNNWVYSIYEEIGTSDSIEERSEITKVLGLIQGGQIKRLVCMALDRLSRNKIDSAYIEDLLIKNNVDLVTPTKVYNWNNESDLMLSDFENLIARQEFRAIKKRMAIGKQIGAEQGKLVAGEPPLGYVIDRNIKKVVIDEEKAKIYRWLVEKYLTGNYTTHTLAIEFNKYYVGNRYKKANNSRIYKILTNRFYLGEVKYKGIWYKGQHEPLITLEDFNKIKTQLSGNNKIPQRKGYREIKKLSQICKCGICGHTMTVTRDKKYGNFIRCWYVNSEGKSCGNKSIKEDIILKQIDIAILNHIEAIEEFLREDNTDYKDKQIKIMQSQIDHIEKELSKLDIKENNIKEMAIEGILSISETKDKLNDIESERNELKFNLEIINDNYKNLNKNIESELINFKSIYEQLHDDLNSEEYNKLLRTLINKINLKKIDRNTIDVDITFI